MCPEKNRTFVYSGKTKRYIDIESYASYSRFIWLEALKCSFRSDKNVFPVRDGANTTFPNGARQAVVPRRELARLPRVNSAAGADVARPGALNSVEELSAAAKEAWEDLPMDLIRRAIPKFRSRSQTLRSRRAVSSHKVLFARMCALSLFFFIEMDENY